MYRTGTTTQIVSIEDQERSVCFICAAEHPNLWSISECSHRVCSICSLRLRLLYKTCKCSWCKVESERIILVRARLGSDGSDHTKTFDELWNKDLPREGNMYFADDRVRKEALDVLKLYCPVTSCSMKKKEWLDQQELKKHVRKTHNLLFCDICLANKKSFPFEYRTFTQSELLSHQKAKDGHPPCSLCGTLFYSTDELTEHNRDKHENCFICQRTFGKMVLYRDYFELEKHFRTEHFPCLEPVCLELKFVVFADDWELKAHMAEMHLSNIKMQRSAQKQFRRIDAGFTFASSGRLNRRMNRGNENANAREREENIVFPNASSPTAAAASPELTPPLPKVMAKNLVFGDSIGGLAQRLQSLNMYEQRNIELTESLFRDYNLNEGKVGIFKNYCRQFQRGELDAHELCVKIDGLMGHENLERIGAVLCDLQLDLFKKKQLENGLRLYMRRIHEFPALPNVPSSTATKTGESHSLTRKDGVSVNLDSTTKPATTLRITPTSSTNSSRFSSRIALDPSKNPLALLGAVTSTAYLSKNSQSLSSGASTSRKSKKPLPSFCQAISTSSSVGIVNASSPYSGASLDESSFPSLPKTTAQSSPTKPNNANMNVFAASRDRNEPEVFVIGGDENAKHFVDKTYKETSSGTDGSEPALGKDTSKKKKGKGTVLLRYG